MIICLQVLCVSSVFLSLLLDMASVTFWCFHHHAFVTCFAMILCIRWNSTIDLMLHLLRGKSTFVFLMQHLNEQTPHYQYGSKIESKNHSVNVFVKHCFVRFSSINEQISTQEDIKFANPSIPPIFLTKVPLLSYWTASVTQGYFQKEFIVMATACLHHRREMNHLVSPPTPASCGSVAEQGVHSATPPTKHLTVQPAARLISGSDSHTHIDFLCCVHVDTQHTHRLQKIIRWWTNLFRDTNT